MSRNDSLSHSNLRAISDIPETPLSIRGTIEKMDIFGLFGLKIESLPFSINDTTAGNETELQAVVIGDKGRVDLSVIIEQSNYFANIIRRSAAGDLKKSEHTVRRPIALTSPIFTRKRPWDSFPMNSILPICACSGVDGRKRQN